MRKDTTGSPPFSVLQVTENWVGPGNEAMSYWVLTSEHWCEQSGDDTASIDGEVEEGEKPSQEIFLQSKGQRVFCTVQFRVYKMLCTLKRHQMCFHGDRLKNHIRPLYCGCIFLQDIMLLCLIFECIELNAAMYKWLHHKYVHAVLR